MVPWYSADSSYRRRVALTVILRRIRFRQRLPGCDRGNDWSYVRVRIGTGRLRRGNALGGQGGANFYWVSRRNVSVKPALFGVKPG